MASLQSVSQDIQALDALLVTHSHKDHISQLKHFEHLPIYSYCDLNVQDHRCIKPLDRFIIGDMQITVIGLSHDAPTTVGYVIEDGCQKLVYITDTGYLPNHEKAYLENADHYIFESNHDIEMLMQTNRPVYIKQRIINDSGHLNNEDSARVLSEVIGERTREIVQAHISQEGNTRAQAYGVLEAELSRRGLLRSDLKLFPAEQFGIHLIAGKNNAS